MYEKININKEIPIKNKKERSMITHVCREEIHIKSILRENYFHFKSV